MNKSIRYCLIIVAVMLSNAYGINRHRSTNPFSMTSGDPSVVKAMTFNIRTKTFLDVTNGWSKRKHVVVNILNANAPDVFGLQEARYSQYKHIRKAMSPYGSYAAGRNNGKESGESCPIFYRKNRFSLADSGTFWFSDTPSVPGSKDWGNSPPRICSWAYLTEKSTGKGLYVYNVHLDHSSQKSRNNSVQLLAYKINARKKKDPFIVMGDFNMKIDNPAMQYLDKIGHSNRFVRNSDAWQLVHPGRTIATRHGFGGSLTGPQIDHIRISSHLRVLDARIDHRHDGNGKYPSDHFPVIAKILMSPVSKPEYTSVPRQGMSADTSVKWDQPL